MHWWQYCTNHNPLIPIHLLIHQLENQGAICRTSVVPYGQCESLRERWRLKVNYHCLNEVTSPLNAALPDMLETQYEMELKAAKWYATTDNINTFFSVPLVTEYRAVCFHLEGYPVHLKSTAPGVETQPCHLLVWHLAACQVKSQQMFH